MEQSDNHQEAPVAQSTHITVIADLATSMPMLAIEAQNTLNTFIRDQAEVEGDCTILLVQFDSQDAFEEVYHGPIAGCPEWKLRPRGLTPLLDAVGRGIARTRKMVKETKPERIFFVILTDGQENASREYRQEIINEQIAKREKKGWEFIFLATGPGAWAASQAFAGTNMRSANTVLAAATQDAHMAGGQHVNRMMAASRTTGSPASYAARVDESGNITAEASDDPTA